MSELRKDPITERWVVMGTSPVGEVVFHGGTRPPERGTCPFCPGNEGKTPPEIIAYREKGSPVNGPGWWVRVFPNRAPVLHVEGDLERRGIGVFDLMNGVGAHEVLVESPEHEIGLSQMSEGQIEKIFCAYRDRILDLQKDRRLRYIQVFKNHGMEAGALLAHPHSQLIALPIVPKAVVEELEGAKRYFRMKERCIFCDISRQEGEQDRRVVMQTEHFLSYAPFASRFPFETWLVPKRHDCCFTHISKEETVDLARALKAILTALSQTLGDPAYNFLLHIAPNAPMNGEEPGWIEEAFHWHLEIMPRLIRVAGFEWGSGLYLNPSAPEEAAARLREVLA